MKRILGIFVMIGFLMSLSSVSAEYWTERNDLKDFLSEDETNRMEKRGVSAHYVYLLAKNASAHNISLGMAFFYNSELDSGWYYGYYITEEGHFIFIDSLTDATLNYSEGARQLGVDSKYAEVTYKCYYPYFSIRGSGEPPIWVVKSFKKHVVDSEDVITEVSAPTSLPTSIPNATAEAGDGGIPIVTATSTPVWFTVGQEPPEDLGNIYPMNLYFLIVIISLMARGWLIERFF